MSRTDSDSIQLSLVRQELETARLNEANLRMEMEQMKLAGYAIHPFALKTFARLYDFVFDYQLTVLACHGERNPVIAVIGPDKDVYKRQGAYIRIELSTVFGWKRRQSVTRRIN